MIGPACLLLAALHQTAEPPAAAETPAARPPNAVNAKVCGPL